MWSFDVKRCAYTRPRRHTWEAGEMEAALVATSCGRNPHQRRDDAVDGDETTGR